MIFLVPVALPIQVVAQGRLDKDFILRQLARVQGEMQDPSLMVVDGNSLWLYFKRERVAQRYHVGNNPMLKKYLMILDNPLEGDWGKLTSIRKEGNFAVLDVIPGEAEGIFSKITLWLSTQNWLIKKLALYEKSGDLTILSYENIQVNRGIPDSRFKVDLPGDVEILHSPR